MRPRAIVVVMLLMGLLSLLTGCNTVTVTTKQYLGMPGYAPTDPASVQILRVAPPTVVERLGEIYAEPMGSPTVQEIEKKMRDEAAKMGANAVVLVADTTMRMGAVVTGPWYDRQISPEYQRVIVGVAVRFIQ